MCFFQHTQDKSSEWMNVWENRAYVSRSKHYVWMVLQTEHLIETIWLVISIYVTNMHLTLKDLQINILIPWVHFKLDNRTLNKSMLCDREEKSMETKEWKRCNTKQLILFSFFATEMNTMVADLHYFCTDGVNFSNILWTAFLLMFNKQIIQGTLNVPGITHYHWVPDFTFLNTVSKITTTKFVFWKST